MSETHIDATSPEAIAPLARHGQLEVDCFCSRCHYNLHGQDVWIDQRLQIPICRCPECGQHHPAGSGVTAHSIWLRRFASLLLAAWIAFVILIAFFACLGFGGTQASNVEEFSYWTNYTKGLTKRVLVPPANIDPAYLAGWGTQTMICFGSVGIGFLVGSFLVTVMWHWPRRRYPLAVVLPIISAAFVIPSYCNDPAYYNICGWCVQRIIFQMVVQMGGILIGVIFGRKLGRVVVRMVIPHKPRQLLAFLWRADGLELPAEAMTKGA